MLISSQPQSAPTLATEPGPALSVDARGLRVAIVSDAAPERNGVGTYYRDLAEHLKAAGAKVQLISPRYRAGRWHGGLAMPMPGDPTQRFLIPPPTLIARRLKRLDPNAIVIPTPGPYAIFGSLLARRYEARLVVGFHTHFERLAALNNHWRLFGILAQTYLNTCHRALFKASHLVLANSDEMLDVCPRHRRDQGRLDGHAYPEALSRCAGQATAPQDRASPIRWSLGAREESRGCDRGRSGNAAIAVSDRW